MEPVRTRRSGMVSAAAKLHRSRERRATNHTLLEGPKLLAEALSAGITPTRVFYLENEPLQIDVAVPLFPVDSDALKRLSGTKAPQSPVAEIPIPGARSPVTDTILILWGVADPGNAGALVRVAAAFGIDVMVGPGSADVWSPKALRAGAGGQFRVGMAGVGSLPEIADLGYGIIATVVSGGSSPESIPWGRWALVMGEEASGLDAAALDAADIEVSIPMADGAESLNVVAAAAILTYVLTRHRDNTPGGSPEAV